MKYKTYCEKRDGKEYFYIRYQVEKGIWRTKRAPVSCSSFADVDRWVMTDFAPTKNADAPEKKTFATLANKWINYREEIATDPKRIRDLSGILRNWILPHPIAHLDIETELGTAAA